MIRYLYQFPHIHKQQLLAHDGFRNYWSEYSWESLSEGIGIQ